MSFCLVSLLPASTVASSKSATAEARPSKRQRPHRRTRSQAKGDLEKKESHKSRTKNASLGQTTVEEQQASRSRQKVESDRDNQPRSAKRVKFDMEKGRTTRSSDRAKAAVDGGLEKTSATRNKNNGKKQLSLLEAFSNAGGRRGPLVRLTPLSPEEIRSATTARREPPVVATSSAKSDDSSRVTRATRSATETPKKEAKTKVDKETKEKPATTNTKSAEAQDDVEAEDSGKKGELRLGNKQTSTPKGRKAKQAVSTPSRKQVPKNRHSTPNVSTLKQPTLAQFMGRSAAADETKAVIVADGDEPVASDESCTNDNARDTESMETLDNSAGNVPGDTSDEPTRFSSPTRHSPRLKALPQQPGSKEPAAPVSPPPETSIECSRHEVKPGDTNSSPKTKVCTCRKASVINGRLVDVGAASRQPDACSPDSATKKRRICATVTLSPRKLFSGTKSSSPGKWRNGFSAKKARITPPKSPHRTCRSEGNSPLNGAVDVSAHRRTSFDVWRSVASPDSDSGVSSFSVRARRRNRTEPSASELARICKQGSALWKHRIAKENFTTAMAKNAVFKIVEELPRKSSTKISASSNLVKNGVLATRNPFESDSTSPADTENEENPLTSNATTKNSRSVEEGANVAW